MDYLVVAVLGLCIGSFLNVCIFRIPKEESISFPPSHCTNCNYKLKWKDLIPVFSYIFLRGRCRNCKQKISIQYPCIELLNCVLYIFIYMEYGFTIETLKFMILASLMIVIGMIDLKTQYVYSSTIVIGAIAGIIFFVAEWINDGSFPKDKLIGMLIGLILIGLIVLLTRGMGVGDIEIVALSGLFLGIRGSIFTLFTSFVLGGIAGILIMFIKKKGRKEAIPFGPYIAIATIMSIYIGNYVINYYLENILNYSIF